MWIMPRIILSLMIIGSFLVFHLLSSKWGNILQLIAGLLTLLFLFNEKRFEKHFRNKHKQEFAAK